MVSDFSLIADHPDREEIVSKLLTGTEPKEINQWLKLKYPDKKHLQVPIKTLQNFNKSQYLDIYQQFEKDAQKVKFGNKTDKQLQNMVMGTMTYQEMLQEYTNKEMDIRQMYAEMIAFAKYRLEQLYNSLQENPNNNRLDYNIQGYLRELSGAIEKLDRRENQTPDQVIHHTHTVQMNDMVLVIQDAIRQGLAKLPPEHSFQFLEEFNQAMEKAKQPEQPQPPSQEARYEEVKLLHERIKK